MVTLRHSNPNSKGNIYRNHLSYYLETRVENQKPLFEKKNQF